MKVNVILIEDANRKVRKIIKYIFEYIDVRGKSSVSDNEGDNNEDESILENGNLNTQLFDFK